MLLFPFDHCAGIVNDSALRKTECPTEQFQRFPVRRYCEKWPGTCCETVKVLFHFSVPLCKIHDTGNRAYFNPHLSGGATARDPQLVEAMAAEPLPQALARFDVFSVEGFHAGSKR